MKRSRFSLGIISILTPLLPICALADQADQPAADQAAPSFRLQVLCEDTPQPILVRLLSGSTIFQGEGAGSNQSPYLIDISSLGEGSFFSGTLEAKWDREVGANLRVQIPASSSVNEASIFVFKPDIAASISSIERMRRRGLSGTNAFKTYFEAKSIYKRTFSRHPKHDVTVLAAYFWHEAAVAISESPSSVIAMDDEARSALSKVEEFLDDDTSGARIRSALDAYRISDRYLAGVLEQSGTLEWRFASHIAKFAEAGSIEEASKLNNYFAQQWAIADAQERSAIVSYHRVNDEWLSNNQIYFDTLLKRDEQF